MKELPLLQNIIWDLFLMLRRRGFAIGLEEYEALQQSLWAGFGWDSREALIDLCAALWAKSLAERETLTALFEQLAPPADGWVYALPPATVSLSTTTTLPVPTDLSQSVATDSTDPASLSIAEQAEQAGEVFGTKTESPGGLPEISWGGVPVAARPFVFVPQLPVSYREIAQTWRRLKRPVRYGAATELDVAATIVRRSQLGISTNVVLQPRRRNIARLLLLVDRQGSMAPFHRFCDEVCRAIQEAGRLEETAIYYFHNVPAEGADDRVLAALSGQLFPVLDSILSQIEPLQTGSIYSDRDLLFPRPLAEVLADQAVGAAVVVISDGGAARGGYRIKRLLDSIAFGKALRLYSPNCVWLNPMPQKYWLNSTASQIARHWPMLPLDREGMEKAVNVLRGQQHGHIIERPL